MHLAESVIATAIFVAGILLLNTGTPKSPETADVRSYLAQFLNDPRIIDIHPVARWLLLNLIILRFRPAKSATAYRLIWTERGSPLLFHGQDLAAALHIPLEKFWAYKFRWPLQLQKLLQRVVNTWMNQVDVTCT